MPDELRTALEMTVAALRRSLETTDAALEAVEVVLLKNRRGGRLSAREAHDLAASAAACRVTLREDAATLERIEKTLIV
jgi:HPt (histidine-containing phosphotransfer) domain-containing protein